jgi:hypothetical protein
MNLLIHSMNDQGSNDVDKDASNRLRHQADGDMQRTVSLDRLKQQADPKKVRGERDVAQAAKGDHQRELAIKKDVQGH